MNHSAAKEPVSFEDLHDASFDAPVHHNNDADIRRNAHMVNGGEAVFQCPKCRGRGSVTIGYSNPRQAQCFKCRGKGNVSKGVAAAAKGKETKARNKAKWQHDHQELINQLAAISDWNDFARACIDDITQYGSLHDWKVEKAEKMLVTIAEKRAAKRAEKDAENAGKSGNVGVEAIDAMFATAKANGLKKPIFRTERLTIKLAPAHGRNAGALYVMDRDLGGEYVGKIVGGKFEARREAKPDTLKLLCEIAGDPMEAAVRYGRSTGTCCICARELTDAGSVAAGIGPVCANKFFG
jgi:hypothetical protein